MCKISVIIPVYNVESYIEETINSLLNQTMKDFEVIFINDGSTDNSGEIINEYLKKDKRIQIINQENSGPSRARNKGIKLAKGEYIAFMDSDDIIPTDSLATRYRLAKENDAQIVVCGTYKYDGIKKWPMIKHFLCEGNKNIRNSYDLLWTLGPCNKLFKTELIKDNKFPEDINYAEDQVFVMDAYLRADKIYASKYVAYYYRVRPEDDKTSLSTQIEVKSARVIDQVIQSWNRTKKSIEENCTNKYTAEKLKLEYFTRLMEIDIWPPFKKAIISKNEKIQLEAINNMERLIENLDNEVFNELPKLKWSAVQGVIGKYLFLTVNAKKRYLEMLIKVYKKFDCNSKNFIKIEDESLYRCVEKATKKNSTRYIFNYLVKRKIKRLPQIINKQINKRGNIVFNIAKLMPLKKKNVILASNKSEELRGNLKLIDMELEKNNKKYDIDLYLKEPERGFRRTIEMYYKFGRAKYIILDDYYKEIYGLKFRKEAEVIQVWHACGAFKKFGFSAIGKNDGNTEEFEKNAHSAYTKVITSSKNIVSEYAEAFNIARDKVIPIGVPRTDLLLDEDFKVYVRRNLENYYPQMNGKKIITYAPTFRGGPKERQKFRLELNPAYILNELGEDYMVILKLHPSVKTGLEDMIIPEELEDRIINLDSDYDINELILISEVVITDYSSVIFEAALLEKKIVMYAYDKVEYLAERDFYYEYDSFVPGPIAKTNGEIIEIIKNDEFDLNKVREFRNKFFDDYDGQSSKRFVENIFK